MMIFAAVSIATSISLAASAAGWVWLRKTLQQSHGAAASELQKLNSHVKDLGKELEDCRRRVAESEQRYLPVAESTSVPASLHLNRRGQVVQLFRRGGTPRTIASALGISQGEVKLIIKMQELDPTPTRAKNKGNLNRKASQILDKASIGELEGEV